MKKLVFAVSMVCAAVFAHAPQAKAASVDVDVDISLPDFLILYCYNSVSVDVSSATFSAILGTGGTADPDGARVELTTNQNPTATGTTSIDADLDITSDGSIPALTSTADLNLQNICAVRGITSTGSADLAVTSAPATFAPGTITGTGLTGSDGVGTIAVGTVATSVASIAVSVGALAAFDVTMPLDFSAVTQSGNFAAAGVVTVQASFP